MLSYKTIVAIQLLQAIHDAGDEGYTVTELKQLTRLQGTAVSRAVFLLKKRGWIKLRRASRYRLTVSLEEATLYDLVMAIDGRIQLATHVELNHWGSGSESILAKAMKLNNDIHDSVKTMLQKIQLTTILQMDAKYKPDLCKVNRMQYQFIQINI